MRGVPKGLQGVPDEHGRLAVACGGAGDARSATGGRNAHHLGDGEKRVHWQKKSNRQMMSARH